jgi:hypothetical protein
MAMLTEKKQKEDGRRADQQQRQSIEKQHGEDLPFSSFCFFSRASHVFPWPQKSEIEQSHPGNFGILLRVVDAVATAAIAAAAPRPPIPPSDDDGDRRKRMGKALLAYHQSSSSSLSSSILRD